MIRACKEEAIGRWETHWKEKECLQILPPVVSGMLPRARGYTAEGMSNRAGNSGGNWWHIHVLPEFWWILLWTWKALTWESVWSFVMCLFWRMEDGFRHKLRCGSERGNLRYSTNQEVCFARHRARISRLLPLRLTNMSFLFWAAQAPAVPGSQAQGSHVMRYRRKQIEFQTKVQQSIAVHDFVQQGNLDFTGNLLLWSDVSCVWFLKRIKGI